MADGIIVFDKPQGMTSHDAVGFIRRLTGARRVGHTGTLDPMAEGVLPVCVGKATRLIEFMDAGGPDAKKYDCEMRLGVTTDTLDVWGVVVSRTDGADFVRALSAERVREVFDSLAGDVEQIPPAYSAIKYKGRKLYEYARAGEEIPAKALRPRRVHIESIALLDIAVDDADDAAGGDERVDVAGAGFATVRFSVVCSGGVYVRSIVRDAGAALGCGAAMSALTRAKSGVFTLADAHTKDAIERAAADGVLRDTMLPPDAGISSMPAISIDDAARRRFAVGAETRAYSRGGEADAPGCVRVYHEGAFLGVGNYADGRIKPYKVIAT